MSFCVFEQIYVAARAHSNLFTYLCTFNAIHRLS